MSTLFRPAAPGEDVEGAPAAGPTPALAVECLRKAFGPVVAVDDVSFTVAAGETVVLLGPSGCGKTTVLRLIAGLERPDDGTVTIGGRTVSGPGTFVPGEERGVGMVFQDWALFPHLTVAANVAYGLPRRERHGGRVEEALEMVGLAQVADRMPATLSGGQQQRVALARTLVRRPRVLLLDEPFSNLDAAMRQQLRAEIGALLARLGIATVFVTHDQEEACELGHRLVVMRDGRVVQAGAPADVYARPATRWVAGFLGEANLVPGEGRGDHAFCAIGPVPLANPATGALDVLVRPEAVALAPGAEGEVLAHTYHGPSTTYEVRLRDGTVLRVRTWGRPALAPGARTGLLYRGEATSAWPR
jgi:iron(III) transport system ATP-binding protein